MHKSQNTRMTAFVYALLLAVCATTALAQSPAQSDPPSTFALRGTLILPHTVIPSGIVLVRDGLIIASGDHVDLPRGVPVIDTAGIIAPGLIDLHNHLSWNVFPRWKPAGEFGNRYDWQQKPIYQTTVEAPHAGLVRDGFECEMERYAELKALTEGETSVVGSLHQTCSNGLARNLDLPAQPLSGPPARTDPILEYEVFPLQMSDPDVARVREALATGTLSAFLIHLAEGAPNDAASTREFTMLKGRGLLLPGVSLIHAVSLKPADFAEMSKNHVGFIWSPRSNLELYGDTADVSAALKSGVTIALAPDWSITGSDGLLAELNFAAGWNDAQGKIFTDRQLVDLATRNAAALAGQSAHLGSLEPGHTADLLVISPPGGPASSTHDALWTLLHAAPTQVSLVVVNGRAVYGKPDLLRHLTHAPWEEISVCGATEALVLTGPHGTADAADKSWAASSANLSSALAHYGRKLAPLSECGQ